MIKLGTLKIANLQLQSLNDSEVVKIAGVVQRVKNWLKSQFSPEFKEKVNALKEESSEVQTLLIELNKNIKSIQNSIDRVDTEQYHADLKVFKSLVLDLIVKAKLLSKESEDFYHRAEIDTPEFDERFKKFLPADYDVELKKQYDQPLKSFKAYSSIIPEIIEISAGSFDKLSNEISKQLTERLNLSTNEIKDILQSNSNQIINSFKQAIVDGKLRGAYVFRGKDVSTHPFGTVQLDVDSAPFEIEDVPGKFYAKVGLIDFRKSRASAEKLKVNRITYVRSLSKSASINILYKKAFQDSKQQYKPTNQVPYKITNLGEVDLANVLREGYKKVFGKDPSTQALAGGWAQVVLEAGLPTKLPCNNIGNIKATNDWINQGKPYFSKDTGENKPTGEYYRTAANWKAFPTPEDGAAEYWRLLKSRYSNSLDWMEAEDPTSAAVNLGLKGYYTADIKKYSAGVSSLYSKFMKEIAPKISGLKSEKKNVPGPKPEVKSWKSEYKEIPKTNEVDSLIHNLTAENVLTNRVKTAILKKSLPETLTLSIIEGANFLEKEEFAKTAVFVLSRYLQSKTIIYKQNDQIQIQASTLGTPITVQNAVQGVLDCLSFAYKQNNKKISAITAPNVLTKFAEEIC